MSEAIYSACFMELFIGLGRSSFLTYTLVIIIVLISFYITITIVINVVFIMLHNFIVVLI